MTEMGGGGFDGGGFDAGGGLDSGGGGLDAGGPGTADLGGALAGTSDLGAGIGSPTPDFSPNYDAFANSPTMTMPGDTGGSVPVIGGIGIGSGTGVPDTTTQSFSAFTPPGAAVPGTPGTSTLGTDTFALTPPPTYPTTDPGVGVPNVVTTLAPTAPPVAADGLDWATTQPAMTLHGTTTTTAGDLASVPSLGGDTSGGFFANIPGMQAGATSVQGLAQDAMGATNELSGLTLALPSFAAIGSDVGVANGALQAGQTTALTQLLLGMKNVGMSIGTAAGGYGSADQAVAQGFGALGMPATTGADATTPAAPTSNDPILATVGTHHYGDTGADVTALQNQLNAAGYNVGTADGQWGVGTQAALAQYAHDHNLAVPAQPNQLDQRAIDLILNAEGNNRNFTQGGRHEIYGIREGNAGYAAIAAASQQYGQGSAGERAAASQYVQNAYNHAGFTGFTDPGEQAAIASAVHMRGPGGAPGHTVQGTSAILHGMATGTTDAYTQASPADVQTVQQMTPDQFQTSFRQAREAYDHDAYGGQVTNHNGVRGEYWATYGHGLQQRYDAEERRFRALGGTP